MSRASRRTRWELAAGPGFSPADVPQVAAGYFWDATAASGLGTTGFKVPEGNRHTSFDLVQTTVASQPTALTENGGLQFRMRKSTDPNPSFLATAGSVQEGWTGSTYVGFWARLPDAGGILTSSNNFYFNHFLTTGNQRRLAMAAINNANNALDKVSCSGSVDGVTSGTSTTWDNPYDSGGWLWMEYMIDILLALGGSTAPDKFKLFANFVLQTRTADSSLDVTSLFDALAPIQLFSRAGGLANVDTTDWAALYLGNGIPSLANRVRLANFRNPTGVLFT